MSVPEGDDPAVDEAAPVDVGGETVDEPFVRYQNSIYRLVSMGGAGLIAILGIVGFSIGRTLDPIPPPQFFFVDGILAFVLFGWYLLGMRCRLDVAESWVHVATKYGDFRIDRDRVDSIEADRSLRGSLQWSGRPLIIRYRDDNGVAKMRKAYGCLPNDAKTQQEVVDALQRALGAPEDAHLDEVGQAVAKRLEGMEPDGDVQAGDDSDEATVASRLAARLATMKPEGDDNGS